MNRIVTALDDVLKTIRKEFGEMSVLRLGDAADRPTRVKFRPISHA